MGVGRECNNDGLSQRKPLGKGESISFPHAQFALNVLKNVVVSSFTLPGMKQWNTKISP
ncbi:HSP20-like chaperone [Sesbania bispinosa]|nr:HSP20-like chaperone [Sesbania bispinosa]